MLFAQLCLAGKNLLAYDRPMNRPLTTAATAVAPVHTVIPARAGTLLLSHTAVDAYAFFVPPLIGVLQIRCELTHEQAAWMLGIGSLTSGLSQPLGAWISDRTDSRLFGALGLLIAAVCLSCIGLADSFATLLPLFALGMIGVGIFHPVGASCCGQIAELLPGKRRSLGVSVFFVFGMVGGVIGSLLARKVAMSGDDGFSMLRYAMIPGILLAVLLHVAIRHLPHRHHEHHLIQFARKDLARRWRMVIVLYFSNAMRFTVNVTLIYLIVRWAEALATTENPLLSTEAIAEQGGRIAGTVNALLVLGMAIGGIFAGTMIPKGAEKWPLVLVPILFSPAIILFGSSSLVVGYGLVILAGISFASMIPVCLGLAQRLLPHRTSMASGLMLGGAWALAVVGPRTAEYCMSTLEFSLPQTFTLTAGLLVLSGLVCLLLNSSALHETVHADPH